MTSKKKEVTIEIGKDTVQMLVHIFPVRFSLFKGKTNVGIDLQLEELQIFKNIDPKDLSITDFVGENQLSEIVEEFGKRIAFQRLMLIEDFKHKLGEVIGKVLYGRPILIENLFFHCPKNIGGIAVEVLALTIEGELSDG